MDKNKEIALGLFAFAAVWFLFNVGSISAMPRNIDFLYNGASNGGTCTIPAGNCPTEFVAAIQQGFYFDVIVVVINGALVILGVWFWRKK